MINILANLYGTVKFAGKVITEPEQNTCLDFLLFAVID